MRTRLSICLLLLAISSSGCLSTKRQNQADKYTHTIAQMTSFIHKQMRKNKIQGLSIALVDDQTVIWAEGFGYADLAHKVPATADTIYKIASITKLFTATAIMQLEEAGKVDLDQPLSTYLPDFSIRSRFPKSIVTPRSIMCHHSGLPSDLLSFFWNDNPPSLAQIQDALKDEYLAAPPNYIFSYSNVGYLLLGQLIEEVTGEDYAQYVETNLLEPLGMNSSMFNPSAELKPRIAKCYRGKKEEAASSINPLAAGGLYSTVRDLSSLIKMVFADGSNVLAPVTLNQMFKPQNENVPLDLDIKLGLGWFLGGQDLNYAGKTLAHGGSLQSYYSQLTLLPQHKLAVVVLANSQEAAGIIEELATEVLRLALEEKTGLKPPEPQTLAKAIKFSPELARFQGYYATSAGLLNVKAGRGGFFTSLGGTPLKLVPLSDGSFAAKYNLWGLFAFSVPQLAKFKFSFENIGAHQLLVLQTRGDRFVFGEKVQPVPLSELWKRRLGKYELLDPGGEGWIRDVALTDEDGFLLLGGVLEGVGQLKVALRPVENNQAVIMGLGRNTGDTVRFENVAGQKIMFYSGYRFQKK
jgi:CubicO group peptidase (beta-lactamase class C family)